jgi:hypothetical protein
MENDISKLTFDIDFDFDGVDVNELPEEVRAEL